MRKISVWRRAAISCTLVSCAGPALGQELPPLQDRQDRQEWGTLAHVVPAPDLDPYQVRRRTWAIAAGSSLAVALYGQNKWWSEGFNTQFRARSEGWFGQGTYAGGVDKLGHFYMNYTGARLFTRAFEWAGNGPEESLQLGAGLTLGIFTAVEVLDGLSKQWSFSAEDAIMNAAGAAAGLLLEKNPDLDRLLDIRYLYKRSSASSGGFDPFGDYSSQVYLLAFKGSGIPALRRNPVLRYLEFDLGYGATGYEKTPSGAKVDPSRHVYVGVSLNLGELLDAAVFGRPAQQGSTQKLTNAFLEFVQVPGTAALHSHTLPKD
jgi:hypothetical protein